MEEQTTLRLRATLSALLAIGACSAIVGQAGSREVAGIVYFTNNTPDDIRSFPVEVLTTQKNQVMAATRLDSDSRFRLSSLKPGKYLLRLSWPGHCVLSYRLDLTKASQTRIRVIMDVDCAHFNGKIRTLPVN